VIQRFECDFDDKDFILLGDFNDNPYDRSLNILETGDPNAPGGPEEIDGPFLANLTEPLMAAGHVSHGKSAMEIVGDEINTLDPMSLQRNNVARGTNQHTGMILFDQILIPVRARGGLRHERAVGRGPDGRVQRAPAPWRLSCWYAWSTWREPSPD
jgi:hypothetical protein